VRLVKTCRTRSWNYFWGENSKDWKVDL
jgi:hypothetical protein